MLRLGPLPSTVLAAFLAAGSALAATAPGRAIAKDGAELRLVSGFVVGDTAQMGLEIALAPGWKTYWRSPGDGGIPPSIDTAGSANVADVALDFPAPVRFGDGYGEGIGYTAPVVLPLRVRLADPSKPGRLAARVMVGICRDICVPVEATLSAAIDPKATPSPRAVGAIAAAKERVPKRVEPGAPLSVAAVRVDPATTPPSLVVTVTSDRPGETRDVFVEGPEDWALPLARRDGETGGTSVWRVGLDGLPKGAAPAGATLRITITEPRRAVEQAWTLD